MKKKLLPLLCALGLLLALVLPALGSGAAPTVYILAVNDKFCDLPGGALPLSVNGTVYVPYTVFDKSATGIDLGVYYGVGLAGGSTTINLYSQSPNFLIFAVNQGTCRDGNGNIMSFRPIVRNSIPYLPAAAVCDFFGLHYSLQNTSNRGTLIRISNDAATMSDSQFLSTGAQAMTTRYNNILKNMDLSEFPGVPSTTPPVSTSPSPGGEKGDVRVYLAVDAAAATRDFVSYLPAGVQLLFLFSPDDLPNQSALVRQVVAAGHSVGLKVNGSPEEALAQLEKGNRLLSHIARVHTRMVSAPEELRSTLTAAGWSCWQTNVNETTAYAILAGVDLKRTVARVALPANTAVASQVLPRLRAAGYDLRQPLETDL